MTHDTTSTSETIARLLRPPLWIEAPHAADIRNMLISLHILSALTHVQFRWSGGSSLAFCRDGAWHVKPLPLQTCALLLDGHYSDGAIVVQYSGIPEKSRRVAHSKDYPSASASALAADIRESLLGVPGRYERGIISWLARAKDPSLLEHYLQPLIDRASGPVAVMATASPIADIIQQLTALSHAD